ncbi:MAG: 4-(cytidine 5'-diphospho)-2-C-methyl-D-erythritol kinase [Elusimicrobiota bacterium]
MKFKANAKINLFLNILSKRKDGYHNIKTVFQEISLCDDIFIKKIADTNKIKILCDNPSIPVDEKNLVYKAAGLLKKYCNIKKGIEIRIKKRIPVGGGLGGGSSNAATVLNGLNILWRLNLHKNQLTKIAKKIGADVPFFTYNGGRCLGEGIGNKLTPLKIKKTQWYVIVKPLCEISTSFVYSQLVLPLVKPKERMVLTKTKKNNTLDMDKYNNDLEDIVIPLYPEIKKIKDLLIESGAEFSLMSGSGSCVFGVAKNRTMGIKIKNCLQKNGYLVWLVHSVKDN